MASGINDTFRQVGVAVGLAVWGAVFVARGAAHVSDATGLTGERPRHLVEAVSSGSLDQALASVPASARASLADAARDGFLSGMNELFVLGGLVAFVGAVLALVLVRNVAGAPHAAIEGVAASEAA